MLFGLCALMAFNCKKDKTQDDPSDRKEHYSFKDLGSDTFYVDSTLMPPSFFCGAFDIGGEEYLGVSNLMYGNKLHLINFGDKTKRYDIDFGKLRVGGIRTFDIQDSLIYAFARRKSPSDSASLHVIDLQGNYVHEINCLPGNDPMLMQLYSYQEAPIQVTHGRLSVTLNRAGKIGPSDVVAGFVDLRNDSFVALPFRLPESFVGVGQEQNRTYFLSEPMLDGDVFHLSYPASGDVYRWRVGGEIEHGAVTSRYLPNLKTPPVNELIIKATADNGADTTATMTIEELILANGKYGRLVAIPGSNLMARLAFHTVATTIDGNPTEAYQNRSGSILVMDTAMTYQAESGVLKGVSDGGLFARRDGVLYFQDMEQTTPALREGGVIVFQKYKLEKL
jgi:hypothetical protein